MRKRNMMIAGLCVVTGVSALTVYADPMNWFPDKPETKLTRSYQMEPGGLTCLLYSSAWSDGSAQFRVVPKTYDWPADGLPYEGTITVATGTLENQKTYKMSLRKDDNDKLYLYGSVPVGSFDLDVDTWYTLHAYAEDGTLLVKSEGGWGFPTPAHWVPLAFD